LQLYQSNFDEHVSSVKHITKLELYTLKLENEEFKKRLEEANLEKDKINEMFKDINFYNICTYKLR
jgi:uncharacterized membrane protein